MQRLDSSAAFREKTRIDSRVERRHTASVCDAKYNGKHTLESCAGRVNPRGLRVPAFAGLVRVRVRAGAG